MRFWRSPPPPPCSINCLKLGAVSLRLISYMKHGLISFSAALLAVLIVPSFARADARPDFDDDAKPILKAQPHLIQQVESLYEVKDSGTAKYPGDDDHRAIPPYIFAARPRGSDGPFYLRLLIQPGPPGRILRVVDMRQVHLGQPGGQGAPPSVANQAQPPAMPPRSQAPAPAPVAQAPIPPTPSSQTQAPAPSAPAQPPSEPTADTPSGPIMDSGSQTYPASAPSSPSLEPPPDPPPADH